MKITTSKTVSDTVDIELPSFFKDDYEIFGLVSEEVFARIWQLGETIQVTLTHPRHAEGAIHRAMKLKPITESEFFAAYDKAIESLRLKPELKTV